MKLLLAIVRGVCLVVWVPLRSAAIAGCFALLAYGATYIVFTMLPCQRQSLERFIPLGPLVLLLGGLLNLVVFVANGFRMPVRCTSVEEEESLRGRMLHRPLDATSSRLVWLADIIPCGWMRVSVGDILYFVGIALLVIIYSNDMHRCMADIGGR